MSKKPNKKSSNSAKRHHYVPQWYQKRFSKNKPHILWFLDKNNNSVNQNIPKNLFLQNHLYTIDLLGQKSDVIERKLFGDIDSKGFKAIDFFTVEDGWKTEGSHQAWEGFMQFMNAQKLRTLKGLDWIKKILVEQGCDLDALDHNAVLTTMQEILYLYCAMWTEAIWEIVSAEKSEVKFIISDNPVTFYNYQILPGKEGKSHPDEPSLSMIGTQTIYPLSLDYCLILTHREIALKPEATNPLQDRINARFYDDENSRAIFSFQDIIYGRTLSDNEVCVFNYVLKKQAKRYIAALRKDWLLPEKAINEANWQGFHKLFLPPKEEVTITTGIFMGHKDGSVEGFDPFGQRVTDPKEIEEIKRCGRIVKKITREKNFSPKLTELLNKYDVPNIEEQNKLLIEGITDIFEMEDNSIETFRDNFNAEKVKKLYLLIDDLWPAGTDIFKMLPKEDNFNIIYSGEIDSQILPYTLFNFGLYFDKAYITNPFPHPCFMKEEFNPIYNPEQYLATTYNLIITMLFLFPWIDTKQIQIVPSPLALDFKFRNMSMNSIEERKKEFDPKKNNNLFSRYLIRNLEQTLLMIPDSDLEHSIRMLIPELPKELIFEVAKGIREKKKNPILWHKPFNEIGSQMISDKICENMETVFYLAQLTNAIPYTYIKFKEDEFEHINSCPSTPIEHKIKLLNCSDSYLIKAFKDSGLMGKIRSTLKKLQSQPNCEELQKELKEAISDSESDWNNINEFLKTKKMDKYMVYDSKITLNIGQFDLPPISNHLKNTYETDSLAPIKMYISTDLDN